jgi:hypothetical protein
MMQLRAVNDSVIDGRQGQPNTAPLEAAVKAELLLAESTTSWSRIGKRVQTGRCAPMSALRRALLFDFR